jgi:hypothetical protein
VLTYTLAEDTPHTPASGDYFDTWLLGGWVEVLDGTGQLRRRGVLNCSQAAGVWTLTLNRPLPASCAEETATVYPGCPGDYSVCKAKFFNGAKFGGFPFMPKWITTASGKGNSGVK